MKIYSRKACRLKHRRAFTVVELLLSLAVVTLIALGSTSMLSAVVYATADQRNTRYATIKRQVATTRIATITRNAAQILDVADDSLILWQADLDGNQQVNLSELVRIDWHSDRMQLSVTRADPDSPPAVDTAHALSVDFQSITASALVNGALFESVILNVVTACSFSTNEPDAQESRVVEVLLEIDSPSGKDTSLTVSALRIPQP